MQSELSVRELRPELEEAGQARTDELAMEAKDKEAKDRGVEGATGKVKEQGRRRRSMTEESGNHWEEFADEYTGESGIFPPTDRRKVVAQKWPFEKKVKDEVEGGCLLSDWEDDPTINTVNSRAHAQSARGTGRKTCTPSGTSGARWENPRHVGGGRMRWTHGGTGDDSAKEHGRDRTSYRTTEIRR